MYELACAFRWDAGEIGLHVLCHVSPHCALQVNREWTANAMDMFTLMSRCAAFCDHRQRREISQNSEACQRGLDGNLRSHSHCTVVLESLQ